MASAINYKGIFAADVLKQAGLSTKDIEVAITLAHNLSEAVKYRRSEIRGAPPSSESPAQQEAREKKEKADDDRVFLGAALFLAGRLKRSK